MNMAQTQFFLNYGAPTRHISFHAILGVVFLAAAFLPTQAANNVLLNPGFEDGTNGWHITAGSATYFS